MGVILDLAGCNVAYQLRKLDRIAGSLGHELADLVAVPPHDSFEFTTDALHVEFVEPASAKRFQSPGPPARVHSGQMSPQPFGPPLPQAPALTPHASPVGQPVSAVHAGPDSTSCAQMGCMLPQWTKLQAPVSGPKHVPPHATPQGLPHAIPPLAQVGAAVVVVLVVLVVVVVVVGGATGAQSNFGVLGVTERLPN